MRIGFIGTGYVGLVSGVMLAECGHQVLCIDTDQDKINKLAVGQPVIYEPGLQEYLSKNLVNGRLNFKYGYFSELGEIDAFFITVGTPSKPDGSADLSYIYDAIDELVKYAKKDCMLVIKSTVPPATTKAIQKYIFDKNHKFKVANNPEFLREGNAVDDFINPDRIVVGAEDIESKNMLAQIYSSFTDRGIELVTTNFTTSELIKYASNTFLANKIAFINEMADLCENIGADINDLSYAVGLDKRIGGDFLKAGPGFGGSCFPKDILALQALSKQVGSNFLILDAIVSANQNRPSKMVNKIRNILGGIKDKKITLLGLTYKAGTDDIRSSPATKIAEILYEEGVNVKAYDPMGADKAKMVIPQINIHDNAYEACSQSDCLVIVTEWPEFNQLDYKKIAESMENRTIIDLRSYLDSAKLEKLGYKYYCVGKRDGS